MDTTPDVCKQIKLITGEAVQYVLFSLSSLVYILNLANRPIWIHDQEMLKKL